MVGRDTVALTYATDSHLKRRGYGYSLVAQVLKARFKEQGTLDGDDGIVSVGFNPALGAQFDLWVDDGVNAVGMVAALADVFGEYGLDGAAVWAHGFGADELPQLFVYVGIVFHLELGFVVGIKDRDAKLFECVAHVALATADAPGDAEAERFILHWCLR